jgi:hypothetical protein
MKALFILVLFIFFTNIKCIGQDKEVYLGASGSTNFRSNYSVSLVSLIPLTPNYFIVSKICDYTLLSPDNFNQQKNNVAYYYPFCSVINTIVNRNLDIKIPEAIDLIKYIIPYPLLCSEHHFAIHKKLMKSGGVRFNYYLKTSLDSYIKHPFRWDRYSFGNGLSCVLNTPNKKTKTSIIFQTGPYMGIDVQSAKKRVDVYGLEVYVKFLVSINN